MKHRPPIDPGGGRATGPTEFQMARPGVAKRITAAAVPAKFRTSLSVAVDGTDLETWGALHGDSTTVEFDGEAAETQLMGEPPPKKKAVRKAKVLGIGLDGRKQYTVDPD